MNVDQLAGYCDRVAARFERDSLGPAMAECADIADQSVRDAFTSSADPITGANWDERVIKGDGHPLLIDTGALLQAATGGGAGHVRVVTDRSTSSGVDKASVAYAGFHHTGTVKMPRRRYLGFDRPARKRCRKQITTFARSFFRA